MPDLTVEVRPPWPYRLPGGGRDGIMTSPRPGIVRRLLHVEGEPVIVAASQPERDRVVVRASAPGSVAPAALELAVERMRFALGVDDDLGEFYAAFRGDPLLGPAVRARPWHRPRRRPWAWEALAWAITEQLIESQRAGAIQRRIVRRWGPRWPERNGNGSHAAGANGRTSRDAPSAGATGRRTPRDELRDAPAAAEIAGCAPAELAALDLAPSRAMTLIRCAREVAAGRVDPSDAAGDRRLLRIPGVGPWTIQFLGLHGRGNPDSLPAGDLAYIKLVGRLAGLGRRATVPEVEELFAPYAPYRGLAGSFVLAHSYRRVAEGPPLRYAA